MEQHQPPADWGAPRVPSTPAPTVPNVLTRLIPEVAWVPVHHLYPLNRSCLQILGTAGGPGDLAGRAPRSNHRRGRPRPQDTVGSASASRLRGVPQPCSPRESLSPPSPPSPVPRPEASSQDPRLTRGDPSIRMAPGGGLPLS